MKKRRSSRELALRYLLFIIGLFFSGLGIAVTRRGNLGVSPISSVPNVVALRFSVLSFGTWLFLWNCALLVLQIVLLRKDFDKVQLLQIPLSVLFGYFTDLGGKIAALIPVSVYPLRLFCAVLGVAVLAFGITLTVRADVVLNAGEGAVKAIADKLGKPFGNVKVFFDVGNVLLSILLSLLFFSGRIVGAREGTIIAALLTGNLVRVWQRVLPEGRLFR